MIPFEHSKIPLEEQLLKGKELLFRSKNRRSIREFSDQPVSEELIRLILETACTAPSGANKQPWTFCAVSDPEIKKAIREAAEKEEYESYHGRMREEWLKDLEVFETNWQKPFLETAPWLIVVFKQSFGTDKAGNKKQHYYVNESVGIACGLVTLTHTPSPMNFLSEILGRPKNEKAFLLLPVGYPAENTKVPGLKKKSKEEQIVWY